MRLHARRRDGKSRQSMGFLEAVQSQAVPEETNAVLMVPLYDGEQIFAVLQGQLADVAQALLIVGAQDCSAICGHDWLFLLEGGVQAGIAQIGHGQWWYLHCRAQQAYQHSEPCQAKNMIGSI